MSKRPSATDFLRAMQPAAVEEAAAPTPTPAARAPAAPAPSKTARKGKRPPRADLKHFGGYIGDETLEKVALLRIRLKKDNSELIELAIDELHRKHNAKRAFGDA